VKQPTGPTGPKYPPGYYASLSEDIPPGVNEERGRVMFFIDTMEIAGLVA